MSFLYSKDGGIYTKCYCEIYIPMIYFKTGYTTNLGSIINTLGILYIRSFNNGTAGQLQLLNIATMIDIHVSELSDDIIDIHGHQSNVVVSRYLKDSLICQQSIQQGREVAERFLNDVLNGKLPRTINYANLMNIWWNNLEISGVNLNVPSKMYEMIIANIYRNPHDIKKRYGEYYGKSSVANGYDYKTGNVRSVVENLSTFSGLIYEDIKRMITSGLNNSLNNIEEPESPLEHIMKC